MKLNIFFLLIIIDSQISYTLIKIPFKITKYQKFSNHTINEIAEDVSFNLKLLSIINIGDPPQNIEVSFDLKLSNYYISNYCKNSSTFYLYNESKTFSQIQKFDNYRYNRQFIF